MNHSAVPSLICSRSRPAMRFCLAVRAGRGRCPSATLIRSRTRPVAVTPGTLAPPVRPGRRGTPGRARSTPGYESTTPRPMGSSFSGASPAEPAAPIPLTGGNWARLFRGPDHITEDCPLIRPGWGSKFGPGDQPCSVTLRLTARGPPGRVRDLRSTWCRVRRRALCAVNSPCAPWVVGVSFLRRPGDAPPAHADATPIHLCARDSLRAERVGAGDETDGSADPQPRAPAGLRSRGAGAPRAGRPERRREVVADAVPGPAARRDVAQLYARISAEDIRDPGAPFMVEAAGRLGRAGGGAFADQVRSTRPPAKTLTVRLEATLDARTGPWTSSVPGRAAGPAAR